MLIEVATHTIVQCAFCASNELPICVCAQFLQVEHFGADLMAERCEACS